MPPKMAACAQSVGILRQDKAHPLISHVTSILKDCIYSGSFPLQL